MNEFLLVVVSVVVFVLGAGSVLSVEKEHIALNTYMRKKAMDNAVLSYLRITDTVIGYTATAAAFWLIYFLTKLRDLDIGYIIIATVPFFFIIWVRYSIIEFKYKELLKKYL